MIISIVGSLLSFYNNNMVKMNDTSDVNMELSKFTARMIAETKEAGNEIAEITGSTIRFKNGNVYTYQDNRIYENTMVVSQYVKDYLASLEVDGSKQILRIHIVLQKGETEITNNLTYVIEETNGEVAMGPTYIINNAGDITVKAESESITITIGDSNNIEQYFTYTTNGNLPIASVKYIDTSNNDKEITNTNSLALGIHQIKCIVTNAKGDSVSEIITIVVEKEPGVYGNVYKLSDTEYHLVLNKTGRIAQGYTQEQLIHSTENIVNGLTKNYWTDLGVNTNITKAIIEETIYPTSTYAYFYNLLSMKEIEGMRNMDTKNVTDMCIMFDFCSSLTSIDVTGFNTANVTNMAQMFGHCSSLTSIDLSSFDTRKVENLGWMFHTCRKFDGDRCKWL